MKLDDYTYNLPKNHIAYEPPRIRGSSRLLVLNKKSSTIIDEYYKNIYNYLKPGDLLVINDSKVLKARLIVNNKGKQQEVIILEKHGKQDDWHKHKILHKGKLKVGTILDVGGVEINVSEVLKDGLAIVESKVDLLKIAKKFGEVPLPPYINRPTIPSDEKRYQTVWAKNVGSVAAPTASLNMTEQSLNMIKNFGVRVEYLTLHVGLGTFMPIRTNKIEDHIMHQEYFEIPSKTIKAINDAKNNGGKIVALGTTVTRTLEFCENEIANRNSHEICGEADIFIYPGHQFKIVDKMITNFHAPKSTVLMMVAAFAGWENIKSSYEHAIKNNYKMLSYGDSMLIE